MKKLNWHQVEEILLDKNIKIFTPRELSDLFATSLRAAQAFINYHTHQNNFVRLKSGLYAFKRDLPHEFTIANRLYSPSYVSLDTALSYHGLIPETVYSITSVTPKATREFAIDQRLFTYHRIKKEAYTGYFPQKINGDVVFLALPEKAAADFLYFVSLGKRKSNDRLRLKKLNQKQLKRYLKLFGIQK